MAEDGTDSDVWVFDRFDEGLRDRVRELATPDVLAEFESEPLVPSDALQRVMEYFGRGPLAGKYMVVSLEAFSDYRIGVLPGTQGSPVEIGDDAFESSDAAKQVIFRRRLRDLGVNWL